jgi:hypothetical protein
LQKDLASANSLDHREFTNHHQAQASSSEPTMDRQMIYACSNEGLGLGLHKASKPGQTPGASGEIRIGMCKWMTLLLTTIN